MLDVRYSTKFKKDFKLCIKRGYKMPLLQQAIDTLRIPVTLISAKYILHPKIAYAIMSEDKKAMITSI